MPFTELDTATNYKVYTPKNIANEMVEKSFEIYFKNNNLKDGLETLRIADISCGTGNLLLCALKKLLDISNEVYGKYTFNPDWIKGFDIDPEALKELKTRSKTLLSEYGLSGEIETYCENSLLSKNTEKYHIILGNPPYFGEKNNKEIFQEMKENYFGKKYYEGKMDYFYFFIEKGIELLENDGILTYITTNYWLRADHGKKLREKIKSETTFIYINNFNISVFKNAPGQHNFIFSLKKSKNKDDFQVIDQDSEYFSKNSLIYNSLDKIIIAPTPLLKEMKDIYNRRTHTLGELLNINQGIVSGCDKAFVFEEYIDEYSEFLKPFYKNKNIHKYNTDKKSDFWILYLNRHSKVNDKLLKHLEKYKEKLSERREARKNLIEWWELQWARDEKIFHQPKIVGRQRSRENKFAYTEEQFYGSADIYYLTAKSKEINLFYILGYLNSSSFYNWFKHNGKIKGYNLELYSTPLKETPIYYSNNISEILYIETLVKKQLNKFHDSIQKKIDDYFKNPF